MYAKMTKITIRVFIQSPKEEEEKKERVQNVNPSLSYPPH